MKILTNWSVPTKAPMKYVRKTAMATMMLAASAVGMTSCDSFTKSKVPDISHEVHDNMLDRLNIITTDGSNYESWSGLFEERGLYGGSLYTQMKTDCLWFRVAAMKLAHIKYGLDFEKTYWNDEDRDANELSDAYYDKYNFQNFLPIMDEELFSNGEPTLQECSNYLDRQVAKLDFLSQHDYEKYHSDVKAFEKAQKKQDEFAKADLLAYKQFKLDSLILTNGLKEFGLLDSYKSRKHLSNHLNKKDEDHGGGLCPEPNWRSK